MKFLCRLLFLVLFFPLILWSATEEKPQLLSPAQTLEVLKTIQEDAIIYGHGKKTIYTFIDPYCELSQRYLSFIFEKQERMFSNYTFYFFLYELKGKNSSEMITTIYSSENKNTLLKAIMLNHESVDMDDNGEAQDIVEKTAEAAKKIGVFKRPYILINGKVK